MYLGELSFSPDIWIILGSLAQLERSMIQERVCDEEIAPNFFVGYAKDGSVSEIQIIDVSEIENPWFNLQAAAAMLGISDRTLQRRIEDGVIHPKKVGREYQITPSDLEKLKKAD